MTSLLAGGVCAPVSAQPDPVSPPPVARDQAPPEPYTYDPAGRRDPFVSLLARGADLRAPTTRPQGLAGVIVNEVALRGIVLSRGAYVAILQAPDQRTYIVRAGDQLFDGVVRSITADGVTFLQDVSDPLSLAEQREVRMLLRSAEEVP